MNLKSQHFPFVVCKHKSRNPGREAVVWRFRCDTIRLNSPGQTFGLDGPTAAKMTMRRWECED